MRIQGRSSVVSLRFLLFFYLFVLSEATTQLTQILSQTSIIPLADGRFPYKTKSILVLQAPRACFFYGFVRDATKTFSGPNDPLALFLLKVQLANCDVYGEMRPSTDEPFVVGGDRRYVARVDTTAADVTAIDFRIQSLLATHPYYQLGRSSLHPTTMDRGSTAWFSAILNDINGDRTSNVAQNVNAAVNYDRNRVAFRRLPIVAFVSQKQGETFFTPLWRNPDLEPSPVTRDAIDEFFDKASESGGGGFNPDPDFDAYAINMEVAVPPVR
ncbi:MAG: hypothetical protein M1833_003441 [Piccolia ochrophora]|nr:MAG: hypothetical protein M1833_003441 [Piccolia ochrophora]